MSKEKKIRLCIIVHPPIALTLLRKQWTFWRSQGFEVSCISGPSPEEHEKVRKMGVKTYVVKMDRFPNPIRDILSLIHLWWLLLWNRFDIIHVSVLKSSLLGAIAARLSGHSKIFYLVRGRTYENMTGIKRKFMNFIERCICRCSTVVVPICHELGDILVQDKLCPKRKIRVIGSGSSAGIDLERFSRTPEKEAIGRQIRQDFQIKDDELVILFVGWLRKDKGINELVTAFDSLAKTFPKLHLILLGNYEPSDPLELSVSNLIKNHTRIHHIPWQVEPSPVYTAADIMAFPSYREGFGNVAMEASAMELPVVASDIMGCREAVENGVTGILVTRADSKSLAEALERLIVDPELRKKFGKNGRLRIEQKFKQEIIWQGVLDIFKGMLNN